MYNKLLTLRTNTFCVRVSNSIDVKDRYLANLKDGILDIRVPMPIDYVRSPDFLQRALPNIIEHFLKLEAERKLHNRLKELSLQTGLSYAQSKIFVPRRVSNKDMCMRRKLTFGAYYWQSKDIKLNAFLMLMPDEIIDGILIHELCHSVHQNHGKEFYHLLESKYPQYRRTRQMRKEYVELVFGCFR